MTRTRSRAGRRMGRVRVAHLPRLEVHHRQPAVEQRDEHQPTVFGEAGAHRAAAREAARVGERRVGLQVEEARDPPGRRGRARFPHDLRDRLAPIRGAVRADRLRPDVHDIDPVRPRRMRLSRVWGLADRWDDCLDAPVVPPQYGHRIRHGVGTVDMRVAGHPPQHVRTPGTS